MAATMFITTIVSMSQNYLLQKKLRQGMRYLLLTVMAATKDVREPGVLTFESEPISSTQFSAGTAFRALTLESCY